jgi:hypothetical protein
MINKTDFLTFLDSPRHLWAIKNKQIEKDEIDLYLQHLLDQGYEVEELAMQYLKQYLMPRCGADKDDVQIQPTYIDGAFEARTDILIKHNGHWDMYEVKSSSKVKKEHKYDATFQYLVFDKGYNIENVYILHLNKDYIRDGSLSLDDLFAIDDITEDIEELRDEVLELRKDAFLISELDDVFKSDACIKPKDCPCISLCHPKLPDYSIYDINNLTKNRAKVRELESMGILDVHNIPEDFELTSLQRKQVDVAKSNTVHIDKDEIEDMFEDLDYPLYFLDYETFNPAIPLFDGYSPFDHITFQYSLHVLSKDGDLKHYEYIHTEKTDPIPNLLHSLQQVIGDNGNIVVWNKGFEMTRNREMGKVNPKYAKFCEDMNDRIFDLMDVFQKCLYDDPKFKGSYSIKHVLPVLVPDLSYDDLDIRNGSMAMASWYDYVFNNERDEKIINDLLKYCELDTLAMVRVFEELRKIL